MTPSSTFPAGPWLPTSLDRGDTLAMLAVGETVYASLAIEGRGRLYRSIDAGASWEWIGRGLPSDGLVQVMTVDHENLYVAIAGDGLFFSRDTGNTWDSLATGGELNDEVYALTCHGNRLYAGTKSGGVYQNNPGNGWKPLNEGLPLGGMNLSVFSLVTGSSGLFANHHFGVHRLDETSQTWEPIGVDLPVETSLVLFEAADGVLYAGSPGSLYQSMDGGNEWVAVYHGFSSNVPLRALVKTGGLLLVGTQGTADSRVYVSGNDGLNWKELGEFFPGAAWSVDVAVAGSYVLAGAGESGIWRIPLPDSAEFQAVTSVVGHPFHLFPNDPNPFDDGTNITIDLYQDETVSLTVCDLSGKEVAVLLDSWKPAGRYSYRLNGLNLTPGFYKCRLQSGSASQTRQMLLLR